MLRYLKPKWSGLANPAPLTSSSFSSSIVWAPIGPISRIRPISPIRVWSRRDDLPLAVARPPRLEDEDHRRERGRNQGFCEVPGTAYMLLIGTFFRKKPLHYTNQSTKLAP